jgi:hypothetical protein
MAKKITGTLLLVSGALLALLSLAGAPAVLSWANLAGALAGVAIAAVGMLDLRAAHEEPASREGPA